MKHIFFNLWLNNTYKYVYIYIYMSYVCHVYLAIFGSHHPRTPRRTGTGHGAFTLSRAGRWFDSWARHGAMRCWWPGTRGNTSVVFQGALNGTMTGDIMEDRKNGVPFIWYGNGIWEWEWDGIELNWEWLYGIWKIVINGNGYNGCMEWNWIKLGILNHH